MCWARQIGVKKDDRRELLGEAQLELKENLYAKKTTA